jgi:hypothetical protein
MKPHLNKTRKSAFLSKPQKNNPSRPTPEPNISMKMVLATVTFSRKSAEYSEMLPEEKIRSIKDETIAAFPIIIFQQTSILHFHHSANQNRIP